MTMIALVDCNSFYCSCERIFNPGTRGRPVIVLSNNDGCAIAFSKEAKKIGFGEMCEPYYKMQERIKKYNVAVFSSNYTLYDDMSKRVMNILDQFTPVLEVYSVDEAFLSLAGFENFNLFDYGKKMRREILSQTGLPVSVGISTTKVLAKAANKIAKKNTGVLVLEKAADIDAHLKYFPVIDIWGIGSKSASKLNMIGIKTAYEFKYYQNENLIQKLLTKTGRAIQDELRGINAIDMNEVEDKKNIATTRSFGGDIYEISDLREALATFASKAAEKLRYQDSVCSTVTAFINTNRFKDSEQHYGVASAIFPSPTSDTLKIIKAAHALLEDIFRYGYGYKKGGVILSHIVPSNERQIDLFNSDPADNESLSQVLDQINHRFGPHTIKSAACGINQAWRLRADFKSQRFTTSWEEILGI